MKKAFVAVWVFVIVLALAVSAAAHGGRTDSSGGHYNRSTGEYHYHHGYSAHQHTDLDGDGILDCPYDFDDKTDHSSGSSSSSSSSSSSHKTQSVIEDEDEENDEDQEEKAVAIQEKEVAEPKAETVVEAPSEPEKTFLQKHTVLLCFAGGIALLTMVVVIRNARKHNREQLKKLNDSLAVLRKSQRTGFNCADHDKIHRNDNEKLCAELNCQIAALKHRVRKIQADFNSRELPNIDVVAPIPKDCFLDDAGLPHTKGAKDLYTVYQSQSGCYHSERCYHAHSGTPKNITEIQFGSPCAKCHPVFDLSWYTRRVQAEKKIQILSDVLSYNASPPKRAENMTAQVPLHPQMVVEAKQKPRQAEQPAQTSNDTSKSSGRQEFTIAIRVQIIFMLIVLLFAYLFGQR